MWSCLTSCRKSSSAKNPNPVNPNLVNKFREIDVDKVLGTHRRVRPPMKKFPPPRFNCPPPPIHSDNQTQCAPEIPRASNFDPYTYAVKILKSIEIERKDEEDEDRYQTRPDSPPVRHHHTPTYGRDSPPVRHHHTDSYDNHHHTTSSYDNHHTSSNDYGGCSTSYDNNTTSYDYGGSSSNDYNGGCSTSYD
jgi:hypothetical protein